MNQWFIIKIDQAYWLHLSARLDEAIDSIGWVMGILEDNLQIAYARMALGMYKAYSGDRVECKSLFRQAIQSLHRYKIPIFLAIAYNNRGICNFMSEDYLDFIRAKMRN